MKVRIALLLLCGLSPAAFLPAQTASLNDVLKHMDAAASTFKSAKGNITYTKVTVIVNDRATEKGQFLFERLRKGNTPDLHLRINFTQPSERIILLRDNKGEIYYPKAKQVEEYDLGKNRQALDQFLLLGFGSYGRDLDRGYSVSLGAETKINGEDVVELDLIPKSPGMLRNLKSVQLFLSKKNWEPVKQVFTEPSGDFLTAEYDSVQLNTPIPDSEFKLQLPKNVKRIKPQG